MKPHEHHQAGENSPEKQMNEGRIIRRMVLECIGPLAEWAENKSELTREKVQSTARKKGLYETYTKWEVELQDFVKRDIEILRLSKPIDFPRLLARGDGEITRRFDELGKQAENTLLACWHQDHGLLIASWPDTFDIPASIQPLRKILIPMDRENIAIWAWSKHNFPQP